MNTGEEKRGDYIISADMKKNWAVQMEITRHILDVCHRHGLKIWADWGTLLGVVRHKGFIPWDDDIDLMMMRDDYEKLIGLADSEFKHPFFLQCPYTDKNYYRGHAQVRKDGTASIIPDDIDQPFHQGIFVDIFVYDNLPDNLGWKWKSSIRKAKWANKCLLTANYKKFCLKKPVSSIKYLIAKTFCLLFGSFNIYRFYERQFTKWNLTDCHRIASTAANYRYSSLAIRIKEKKWYDKTVMMPFEDMQLPIPEQYDKVLTVEFGADYMTPRHNSTSHGEIMIYTDRPYQEVLQDLRKEKRR